MFVYALSVQQNYIFLPRFEVTRHHKYGCIQGFYDLSISFKILRSRSLYTGCLLFLSATQHDFRLAIEKVTLLITFSMIFDLFEQRLYVLERSYCPEK